MDDKSVHERCKCTQSFAPYYNQTRHSDVTIVCKDGTRIPAHKVILCLASAFFEKALDPEKGFQEAQQNEIKLEDHEPKNIGALLEFVYTNKYTTATDRDVHQQLVSHASMYAVGDYFMVACLCDMAHELFTKAIEHWQDDSDFASIIEFVYVSTPDGQRGLRDVVVDVAAKNYAALLEDPKFRDAMDTVGQFSRDMATLFFNRSLALVSSFGGRQFLCTYCVDRYSIPADGFEGLSCRFCRRGGKVVAIRD